MISKDFREAHDNTDTALADIAALMEAMFTVAHEHEASRPIFALITCIEGLVQKAQQHQSMAWAALCAGTEKEGHA